MDKILNDYFLSDEQIDAINHSIGRLTLEIDEGQSVLNCAEGDGWFILAAINTLIMFFMKKTEMPIEQLLLLITQMATQSIGGVAESEEMSKVMHELVRRIADE